MATQTRTQNVRAVLDAAVADHRTRRLRAFLYGRTSRDPKLKRTSTRDQESENRRTCDDHGWDVVDSFEDPDLSASRRAKKQRPDFESMVERARAGECDVIVFCDASRGYRDLEVYIRLRNLCLETGVLLCYNGDVYDMSRRSDRKRSAQDAIQAEDEADQISERVLRTKRWAAERGAPVGRIPFGFRRVYDQDTGKVVQLRDDETAELVNEAVDRVLAGETLWAIARDFQGRGIPCPHGSTRGWEQTALKRILINPAIVGKRVHQGDVVGKAAWNPIVDEARYYACRQILTDPGRRTQRGTEVRFLLSGLGVCVCGGLLRPRARTRARGGHVYTCIAKFDTSIESSGLDDYVQAALLSRLESPEFQRALVLSDGEEKVQAALAEVAELQAQLDEAQQLVGRRKLSVASLAAVEAMLAPQIAEAQRRVDLLAPPPLLTRVAGPGARQVWEELDLLARREVLRVAVRVTLHKARVKGLHGIEEGRVGLEWLR